MTVKDETMPEGRWKFDQSVADSFPDMLERSIPDYALMRKLVHEVASHVLGLRHKVRVVHKVVDLGCSRGDAIADLVAASAGWDEFYGVDVSEPMIEAACSRFAKEQHVQIFRHDLVRAGYPIRSSAALTMCVLTLQFTPLEHRLRILRDVWEHTEGGGALILVEKVIGASAAIDALLVAAHEDRKRVAGYTDDQIARKKLSLEGVLVPLTARWNEEMLRASGFDDVDCFWRSLGFAAWIARRSS